MKAKKIIICLLALLAITVCVASIGVGDFSVDAKRGLAWHFTGDKSSNYSIYEPRLKEYIENLGLEWNTVRINADTTRAQKIHDIREHLRTATDEQIAAALTALGL